MGSGNFSITNSLPTLCRLWSLCIWNHYTSRICIIIFLFCYVQEWYLFQHKRKQSQISWLNCTVECTLSYIELLLEDSSKFSGFLIHHTSKYQIPSCKDTMHGNLYFHVFMQSKRCVVISCTHRLACMLFQYFLITGQAAVGF